MCGMVKPSFIPPDDIRKLRDLVRYRFKLTNMITGEKNRAHNCLTVSNPKLDDVFTDIFGKSSRSITEHILQHPGEAFDVTPFVVLFLPPADQSFGMFNLFILNFCIINSQIIKYLRAARLIGKSGNVYRRYLES